MKGFVYILESLRNGRFYIGSTPVLEKRITEHFKGKSKYTRNNLPLKLVFSQEYLTLTEARKIEYKLKRFKSRDIIKRVIKEGKISMGS